MEFLKSWAMTVCGVIVFGSICEMLLPNSSLKKYVRLALGLIMILTILMPVQKLLQDNAAVPAFSFAEKADQTQAYLTIEEMEEKQQQQVIRIYQDNLNERIGSALAAEFGSGITVKTEAESESEDRFGELNRVLVMIDAGEQKADISDAVRAIVTDVSGVVDDKIEIQYLRQTDEKVMD